MATKPRHSPRHAPPSRPPWLLFVAGITIGVFATLLVSTFLPRTAQVASPAADKADDGVADRVTNSSTPSSNKPAVAPDAASAANPRPAVNPHSGAIDYQFDGVLKASEVPGRDQAALIPPAAAKRSDPTTKGTAPQRMLLQAGSFRAAGDADSLRAELLLLAVGNVTTRDTLLPSGEVWHRVMIGPFANEATMRSIQARLARQNIDTFPIPAPAAIPHKPTQTTP